MCSAYTNQNRARSKMCLLICDLRSATGHLLHIVQPDLGASGGGAVNTYSTLRCT